MKQKNNISKDFFWINVVEIVIFNIVLANTPIGLFFIINMILLLQIISYYTTNGWDFK